MGAGASSMNRLRKAILMRAYNVRNSDETLEEQFRKYAYRKVSTWLAFSRLECSNVLIREINCTFQSIA